MSYASCKNMDGGYTKGVSKGLTCYEIVVRSELSDRFAPELVATTKCQPEGT